LILNKIKTWQRY